MTTYFRDFTAESLASPVTGVSVPWSTPDTYDIVSDDGLGAATNLLDIYNSTSSNLVLLNEWGAAADQSEIYVEMYTPVTAVYTMAAVLAGGGTLAARYAICIEINMATSSLRIRKYAGGSPSTLAEDTSISIAADTLYSIRLKIDADGYAYGRIWETGSTEPATWNVEYLTDTGMSAGLPGLLVASSYAHGYFTAVGYADAGEEAPSEPSAAPTAAFTSDAPAYNLVDNEQAITFSDATSGGTTPYTYLWEYSTNGGSTWTTLSTVQAASLTPTAPGTWDVRLTVTDSLDESDTSAVASYTVEDSSNTYIREPADRGQLLPEDSTITGGSGTTPTILLVPRPTDVGGVDHSRYINGVVYNLAGKSPTIVLDWSTYDGGGDPGAVTGYAQAEAVVAFGMSPVWTTTPNDPTSWATFPTVVGDNTAKTITASGVTFGAGEDTVYIAMNPLMTYTANRLKVEALASNSLVGVPDSVVDHGSAPFVFATLPALDSWGIPALDQRCFRIGSGPVMVAVTDSQHANEDVGDHAFWAFVEHLLGSSAEAVAVRSHFTLYCYTMVNPRGRYGGVYRQAPYSGGTADPNREWDTSTLDCVNNVKTAITTDLGATFDGYLDFHGYGGVGTGLYINESDNPYGTFSACNDDFAASMDALTTLEFLTGTASAPNLGISRNYFQVTVGCQFAANLENGMWHNTSSWPEPWSQAMVVSMETMYQAGNLEIAIGSLGALTLANISSGVRVTCPAVSGGDEYRILRDDVEVRGWDDSPVYVDTDVVESTEYTYTYQVRNPYQDSSVSDGYAITYTPTGEMILAPFSLSGFSLSTSVLNEFALVK